VTTATATAIPRGLLLIVGIAAALVAALGLKAFSDVVGPLFLAVVLSIIVHPVRRLSHRFGLPAWVGMILSLVAVYCIVAGLLLVLVLAGAQLAGLLEESAPEFQAFLQSIADKLGELGVSQDQLQAVANGLDPGKLVDVTVSLLGGLAGVLSSVSFLVLLLFFTVSDAGTFAARLAEISPAGYRLASAFQLFARGSRRYLGVSTVFGAGVALLDFIALLILDIRYAWLWALLAFVTNFIPNVGFIIGLVPPTILALVDHGAGTAIAVVVIYCVLNIILQSVIQPRVVGIVVGLSATISFVSLVVWTSIMGAVGALLAVPATLLVKALFVDVDARQRWVQPLLSNAPEDTDTAVEAPTETIA
jgi:predicted PurR-regulated permease PerM